MIRSNVNAALHLVHQNDGSVHRLALARRHVETAIAHINDAAQYHVPLAPGEDRAQLDELRAIVTALADIREGLQAAERAPQHEPSGDAHLPPSA